MTEYVFFFLLALAYTLGAVVICGLAVSLLRKLFISMMGGRVGRGMVLATSFLGTPIHELGHAIMCLLFGHRIVKMSLWQPNSPDGTLGFVTHTYNRRNPYHVLGNLFIGIGPILSGLAVITLALYWGFPDTFGQYFTAAPLLASRGDTGLGLLAEGIRILPHMLDETIRDFSAPIWLRILMVLVILAVSQHISLSPADIKGALRSIPLYLAIILALTAVCAIIGRSAMDLVLGYLAIFSSYVTALFVLVLIASLIQIIIALPVWLIRRAVRH